MHWHSLVAEVALAALVALVALVAEVALVALVAEVACTDMSHNQLLSHFQCLLVQPHTSSHLLLLVPPT